MAVVEHFQSGPVFLTCDDPFEKPLEAFNPAREQSWQTGISFPSWRTTSSRPVLEAMIVAGENGSELTIDEENRIRSLKDAVGRTFLLQYEGNQISQLTDEQGTWRRQKTADGRFADRWQNTDSGANRFGNVLINQDGLSISDRETRTLYSPCGTSTVERFVDGKVAYRTKVDAEGNCSTEDVIAKTVDYQFADGRSARRNLQDSSLLGFDALGNLTVIKDATGRRFEFQSYDQFGQPHVVLNERGTWRLVGENQWCNQENGQLWCGCVNVDRGGFYTYIDASGKTTSRFSNGSSVEVYGGIRTITDRDGVQTRQYLDDRPFSQSGLMCTPRFNVKNGKTTDCRFHLQPGRVVTEEDGDDHYALIRSDAHAPVSAFQDGVVVFSTRCPEPQDRRSHAVIPLSGQDLSGILKLQDLGCGKDLVVVQTYDSAQKALRYQFYAGLEQANVVIGDRVRAGQPIGRLSEDQTLRFVVKNKALSGTTVRFN